VKIVQKKRIARDFPRRHFGRRNGRALLQTGIAKIMGRVQPRIHGPKSLHNEKN
jgi:hypothetical protein